VVVYAGKGHAVLRDIRAPKNQVTKLDNIAKLQNLSYNGGNMGMFLIEDNVGDLKIIAQCVADPKSRVADLNH
jgi:hypothetical protein